MRTALQRMAQQSKIGRLVVVSGPSGVGKSTVVREVLRRTGAAFSVSVTTRGPRDGEVDGREYRFVDRAAFDGMVRRGELLEWAEVFGRLYGTPEAPVREALAAGKTIILEIDVQGGIQVHRKMPDAAFVLILPPGQAELTRRLTARCSESSEGIAQRLDKANEETALASRSGVYNDCVVNDDLETAIRQVVDIVKREQSKK